MRKESESNATNSLLWGEKVKRKTQKNTLLFFVIESMTLESKSKLEKICISNLSFAFFLIDCLISHEVSSLTQLLINLPFR